MLGRSDTVIALNNGIKIELESMVAQVQELVEECDVCVLYIYGKLVLIIEQQISIIQKIIDKFNEGQPYYSRISDYIIIGVRNFPRTNSGKLKKNELIKMAERR